MPGRNDPCPCGSGKKFKKCCLNKTFMESQGTPNMATGVLNELTKEMENLEFSSMDEINRFTAQFMENLNNAPKDDFLGLSSMDIQKTLNNPHGSTHDFMSLVSGDDFDQERLAVVPVMAQTLFLLNSLGESEKGVKATQKGNLPRALVHSFYFEFRSIITQYLGKPTNQQDLQELDVLVFILKELGFIKIRTGWISVTKKGRGYLGDKKRFELYGQLFDFFANSYNWLSMTYYDEEYEIIQQAMSFGLYIVKKRAGNYIDKKEIAALFHKAFPMIKDPQSPFTHLFLDRFCFYFGLVERDSNPGLLDREKERKYRQSALFKELLKWKN